MGIIIEDVKCRMRKIRRDPEDTSPALFEGNECRAHSASCTAGERCVLLVINTLVIAFPREQWFKLLRKLSLSGLVT